MTAAVHRFADDLARSEQNADSAGWLTMYQAFFPGATAAVYERDVDQQRQGIDRRITTPRGEVTVDEKIRKGEWPDFLLEVWSAEEQRVPGWACKPLACDHIAYVFASSRRCYLIPVPGLRHAWTLHGARWVAEHERVEARNDGYTTVSVAVPREEFLNTVSCRLAVHTGRTWQRLAC